MSAINISLPSEQVKFVDSLVSTYGYANRSELIRSILRLIRSKPNLIDESSTFPFISPETKSAKKIITDFKKTGKYSKEFLKDLKEGLSQSDYFAS